MPPTLSYGYDAYYPRLTSTGSATQAGHVGLAYVPAGTLGAGQTGTITNNLNGTSASATITHTYDEWGRRVGSNIDGNNAQSVVFDSLGRVTNVLNLLAPTSPGFAVSYFDSSHPTNRIGSISYPNGQSTTFNYFNSYNSFTATGDENLKEIKNFTTTGSTVLSQNDYTVDAEGKILTWQQQTDSNTPLLWTEGYDAADQLTSSYRANTSTGAVATNLAYHYDAAGNGTQQSGVPAATFNADNQLTNYTPPATFAGTLNETAALTVSGTTVGLDSSKNFVANPTLTNGTNVVTMVARDTTGNQRTNKYQVVLPSISPTYDADGNELTNGTGETYTWDPKNELASIVYTAGANSGNHTEFTYDALGHRIAIVERTGTTVGSGTITSTKQLVWDGTTMAEERNTSNTVTKRFYAQGEQISGTSYYYTFDHLGSVREMTNTSGTIEARYDYDPYGNVTVVTGTIPSDFQYAGMYEHATSGLDLPMLRGGYDPNTGRFIQRDHLGEQGGINLYAYVLNDPINLVDFLGLDAHITYTDGTTSTASTGQDFINQLNNAAPGSISDIRVEGHGNENEQYFSRDVNSGVIQLNPEGNITIDPSDASQSLYQGPSLTSLLNRTLAPGGSVELNGCHTANLAAQLSKQLTKPSTVSGWEGATYPLPGDQSTGNWFVGEASYIMSFF